MRYGQKTGYPAEEVPLSPLSAGRGEFEWVGVGARAVIYEGIITPRRPGNKVNGAGKQDMIDFYLVN